MAFAPLVAPPLAFGSGDNPYLFAAATGRQLNMLSGTQSAPKVAGAPLLRAAQVVALPTTIGGNLGELEATAAFFSRGVTGNQEQVTALAAIAELQSDDSSSGNDAGAGYFSGVWDNRLTSNNVNSPLQAANIHGIEASFHMTRNTGSPNIILDTIESQVQEYFGRNSGALAISAITGDGTTTTVTVTTSPSRFARGAPVVITGTAQAGWDALNTAITSVVGDGATATVVATAHGLATGARATISGTTNFNGTWVVAVVDANTFTFPSLQAFSETPGAGRVNRAFLIDSITGLTTFTFLSTVNDTKAAGTATSFLGDRYDDRSAGAGVPWSAALDLASSGLYRAGAGLCFNRGTVGGNTKPQPSFHAGIFVPSFASVGDGRGSIDFATYVDLGGSDYSIFISMLNASAPRLGSIVVDAASGPVILGAQTLAAIGAGFANAVFAATAASSTSAPLLITGSQASRSHYNEMRNGTGRALFYVAGANNAFLSGDVLGSVGIKLVGSGVAYRIGSATAGGAMFAVTEDAKWAFGGAAPTVKATISGSRGGNVALAALLTELAAKGMITDGTTV